MANNNQKDVEWAEAKKKCRLNEETVIAAHTTGDYGNFNESPRSKLRGIRS